MSWPKCNGKTKMNENINTNNSRTNNKILFFSTSATVSGGEREDE